MADVGGRFTRLWGGRIGLRKFQESRDGGPRLLAFPYAGGQSLAFRTLAKELPDAWGVWAIDPPGHGWSGGPPLDDISDMVDAYLEHLPKELLADTILMGHSLGGCLVFALAQRMKDLGIEPKALILSGTRPPHRKDEYESFHSMDDQRLLDVLIQIGGIPADWANDPEVFNHFKEALRADFRAFENFDISRPLEGMDVFVIGGLEDVVCRPEHVFEWSQFCPGCRVDFVSGEHMFIQTNATMVARRIRAFVEGLSSSTAPGADI